SSFAPAAPFFAAASAAPVSPALRTRSRRVNFQIPGDGPAQIGSPDFRQAVGRRAAQTRVVLVYRDERNGAYVNDGHAVFVFNAHHVRGQIFLRFVEDFHPALIDDALLLQRAEAVDGDAQAQYYDPCDVHRFPGAVLRG